MQIPGNLTSPRLKLAEGEEVLQSIPGLRKKGLFGSRYGTLYLTDRRLAFVKAIMRSGVISAAISAKGAKPMLEFDRERLGSMEKVQLKKQTALVISSGGKTEKFLLDETAIDGLLAQLAALVL